MKKSAFTMIELVFVIVVLGILAAIAIPRLQNDSSQEAADQILADIRYTQHLALTDDVTNPRSNQWQRAFWSIRVEQCSGASGWHYMIGSDRDLDGNINRLDEPAIDSLSGKPMWWNNADCKNGGDGTVSPKIFITKKFGINNVVSGGSCTNAQYIGFDHMGRPHQGFAGSITANYASLLRTPCTITFTQPNHSFTISIAPETGYAFIVGQENQ